MVEQRLFHKDIFQSSLYYQLGEFAAGKDLHAQRVFSTLILMADDYGRGRFMATDIRIRAFASAPSAFGEVALSDIEEWVGVMELNGAIIRYKIGIETYFFLPKWPEYQPGIKYRCRSRFPCPSDEILSTIADNLAEFQLLCPTVGQKQVETDKPEVRREEKRREEKRREDLPADTGSDSKGKGKGKADKSPDSKSLQVTDHYQALYLKKFGKKPVWNATTGKRTVQLLADFKGDTDRICKAIANGFKSKDSFIVAKVGSYMTLTATSIITQLDAESSSTGQRGAFGRSLS